MTGVQTCALPISTYNEKYKRRYPVVLLVIAGFNALSGLGGLATGRKLDLGTSAATSWAIGIAFGALIFVSAAFWTAIASAFGGRKKDPAERRPLLARAWTWVPVGVLAVVVTSALTFQPAVGVAPVTVTSEAQGCTQFLTTFEDAAKANVSIIGAKRYLQPLHDASVSAAPKLASDLQAFLTTGTEASLTSMTEAVVTRCLADGYLTPDQVTAFGQRLQALSPGS